MKEKSHKRRQVSVVVCCLCFFLILVGDKDRLVSENLLPSVWRGELEYGELTKMYVHLDEASVNRRVPSFYFSLVFVL